jgi:hypothetical protein
LSGIYRREGSTFRVCTIAFRIDGCSGALFNVVGCNVWLGNALGLELFGGEMTGIEVTNAGKAFGLGWGFWTAK